MPEPSNKVPNWANKKKNTRTLWQKFRGDDPPLPQGTMKKNGKSVQKTKTQKGSGAPEYLLRAANMLSERSNKTRNANLKILNKTNRNNLRKLLGKTRRNNRNQ